MNAFSLIASGERTLFRRQEVIRDQRNFWGEFRLSLHGQNELASRVFPLKWHKHTKQATYTHWYENGITSMDNRTLAISHHAQTSTLLSSSSSSCTDNKLNLLLFPSTTKFWLAWEKTQTKKKLFTLKNVMGGWIRDNLQVKQNIISFSSILGTFPRGALVHGPARVHFLRADFPGFQSFEVGEISVATRESLREAG